MDWLPGDFGLGGHIRLRPACLHGGLALFRYRRPAALEF